MICVGFGQNVIDHYFCDGKYIGSSAGGSVWNIISNLASLGCETVALGTVSGDYGGQIFLEEMEKLSVNIEQMIVKKRLDSNAMFIDVPKYYSSTNRDVVASYKCPICGKSHWKARKSFDVNSISFLGGKEVLLVLDNIKDENIELIDKIGFAANKLIVAMDLGHKYNMRFKKSDELKKFFSHIDILQTKLDVMKFLLQRVNMTIKEFMIECKIGKIIVTSGLEGCNIYELSQNQYNVKEFHPREIYQTKDSSGAGDTFFARYLYQIIFATDENSPEGLFDFCQIGVKKVLEGFGAKSNLGIKLKEVTQQQRCDCNNLSHTTRESAGKTKFKCLKNYEAAKNKIQALNWCHKDQINDILREKKLVLCVGTGASYVPATFISHLLLLKGIYAISIYPYEINEFMHVDVGDILIFSASGKTYDNIQLVKKCCRIFDFAKIRLITSADKSILLENYTKDIVDNSIIYKTNFSQREQGFLSFWGVLGPIIYMSLLVQNNNEDFSTDIKRIMNKFTYWDSSKDVSNFVKKLLQKDNKTLDIIFSSENKAAAIALESMFTESGTYRCLLHEEKNFSHGRFITNEYIPAAAVIIMTGVSTSEYENELIEYIKKQKQLLLVLEPTAPYPAIDLIIAVYSLIIQYAIKLNSDISNPQYTSDSMKLYKFK